MRLLDKENIKRVTIERINLRFTSYVRFSSETSKGTLVLRSVKVIRTIIMGNILSFRRIFVQYFRSAYTRHVSDSPESSTFIAIITIPNRKLLSKMYTVHGIRICIHVRVPPFLRVKNFFVNLLYSTRQFEFCLSNIDDDS